MPERVAYWVSRDGGRDVAGRVRAGRVGDQRAGRGGRSRTLLHRMAEPNQLPIPSSPGRRRPWGGGGRVLGMPAVAGAVAAVLVGTALLGVAAGFTWAAVAPHALAVVVGRGSADVVNPETSAFIAADGWFTLLTAIGGVISGLLGYTYTVRRHGPIAMAAVLAGGVPAALIAMWIGQKSGNAGFNHALQVGQSGVLVHAPLSLGGIGALAFWSLFAGLTAGGIEAVRQLRERQAARARLQRYAPPGPSPVPGTEGPTG
jgi:hypothetical protein